MRKTDKLLDNMYWNTKQCTSKMICYAQSKKYSCVNKKTDSNKTRGKNTPQNTSFNDVKTNKNMKLLIITSKYMKLLVITSKYMNKCSSKP